MIDWLQEAKKHENEMVKMLSDWIKCKSVYDDTTKSKQAPFGKGVRDAHDFILNTAKEDGFVNVDDEGYACHIDYGEGETIVGILGHYDVVPEGEDWEFPAFSGTVKDGKVFGRGSQDDKGPVVASYFAMKIIRELGLPVSKKARMILGGNEESSWQCVEHYFKNYPKPDYGFTPDGDFPLVYAEKIIQMYEMSGVYQDEEILSFVSGTAANAVPDSATVETSIAFEKLEYSFNEFVKENNVTGEILDQGGVTKLIIHGVGAHASTPEVGVNAAALMLKYLKDNSSNAMTAHFADVFKSYDGSGLGIKFNSEKMGPLTANLGIVEYKEGKYRFELDTRYPTEMDADKMFASIEKATSGLAWESKVTKTNFKSGVFLDLDSDLVKTLMKSYVDQTNDTKTQPFIIGGGTFARAAENIVCFGMIFPDGPRLFHQKNEYVKIDDLVKGCAIYAQAIYDLIK